MNGSGPRGVFIAAACLLPTVSVLSSGCHSSPRPTAQTYFIRGLVEEVQPATGTVLLKHEAVAGLMPAMTMAYPLEDASAATELHHGDRITATLLVDRGPQGPTHLRLTDLDIIGQAKPDEGVATGQFHVPALGDTVPDFSFLNQSGKRLRLGELRGKVVAITFVYTRCPVAEYCPRMSRNFAQIDQALAKDPTLYEKTHLLSISFDPGYDTPAVLRSYGGAYTGRYTREEFRHWSFAAPSAAELPKIQRWFDLGITPLGSGSLQHSLSTVILGTDGRVVAFYPNNEWTVVAAMTAIREAAKV